MSMLNLRGIGRVGVLVLALLAWGQDARAQGLEIGAFGSRGDGPTPVVAFGVDVRLGIPWISVVGEASSWGTWAVDCPAMAPGSYRCSTGGGVFLAGLRVVPPHTWSVRPYLEGKVGTFGPTPIPPGRHRPRALSTEIGVSFQLQDWLALELGGRKIRVDDEAYQDVFDEKMVYSMLTVRFVARVPVSLW